jgi:diguanylate cyclase (GGDEF)-like protein
LLLPDTSAAKAKELAERLRNAVVEQNYFSAEGVSVSIGVSQIEGDEDSIELLVEKADRNMYTAKQRGRNCVE